MACFCFVCGGEEYLLLSLGAAARCKVHEGSNVFLTITRMSTIHILFYMDVRVS